MIFSDLTFWYLGGDSFAGGVVFDFETVETIRRIENESVLNIQVDNRLFINVNVSLNTTIYQIDRETKNSIIKWEIASKY